MKEFWIEIVRLIISTYQHEDDVYDLLTHLYLATDDRELKDATEEFRGDVLLEEWDAKLRAMSFDNPNPDYKQAPATVVSELGRFL